MYVHNTSIAEITITSREFFTNGKWDKQIHPVSWLVRRFSPVTGWSEEDIKKLEKQEELDKLKV